MSANGARCAHCGRDRVGSYERGYASVGASALCHPNDDGPDCYFLVTVMHHPMPCGCDPAALEEQLLGHRFDEWPEVSR